MIQLNPRYSDVPSYSFPLTNIDLNYNEFDNRKKEERFLLNKGSIISRTQLSYHVISNMSTTYFLLFNKLLVFF
ncbi:hypothetical protein B1P92_14085 [Enterococcus faecium]|nr:hypothetical protein B1P92_14085 [Enterococcus faecium]